MKEGRRWEEGRKGGKKEGKEGRKGEGGREERGKEKPFASL